MSTETHFSVIDTLRPKLKDYLISQGIEITESGFFRCIHPDHPDRNPSVSLNYGNALENQVFHCFSGGSTHDGNIFTAAHWLEGMPLVGHEFWEVTVKTLCERFNITYTPIQISEDNKRKYQALRTLSDAVKIITSMTFENGEIKKSHIGIKHLLDRGITPESISKFKIGIITSKIAFDEQLKKLGHTDDEFLAAKGFKHHSLLNRDGFIIPIDDINGRPVGFVSRNCRMEQDEHGNHKYVNSPNTDVYKKGEILFGYDKVKNKNGPLYIVEGYLDAIYLQQENFGRVVALGSTSITDYQIEKILYDNETNIYLCLDADNSGIEGTRLAIDRMSPFKKFNIKIMELPDGIDPDTYARQNGIDGLKELSDKALSPFKWSLKHTSFSEDFITLAKRIIPTIAAEESSVERIRMIKELSDFCSIPEMDIRKDVELLVNKKDNKYIEELESLNNYVQVQLNRSSPTTTKKILMEAMFKMENIENKFNAHKNLVTESRDRFRLLKDEIISGNYEYGLKCPNHNQLEHALGGIPYQEKLMYVGGRASSGKALPNSQPIPSPNGGYVKHGDIKVGDVVFGSNGKPTKVTNVYPQGLKEIYNVTFSDGRVANVVDEHLWKIKNNFDSKEVVTSTIEIMNHINSLSTEKGKRFPTIQYCEPLEYINPTKTDIDPWLLGVLISNVELRISNAIFTHYEKDVIEKLKSKVYKLSIGHNHNQFLITDKSLSCALKKYGLFGCYSYQKFIPKEYFNSSVDDRIALLQGLIDANNNVCIQNKIKYTTLSKRLAEDIQTLVRSLGGRCTMSVKNVRPTGILSYKLYITFNKNSKVIPCSSKKHLEQYNNLNTNIDRLSILSVTPTGKFEEATCITVEAEDHLYVINDYIVTHNTALMNDLSMDIVQNNSDVAIFYMSIDDSFKFLNTKRLAILSGLSTTEILQYKKLSRDNKLRIDDAYEAVENMSERYIVADSTDGNTIDTVAEHLKWFTREFQHHKRLFILDKFVQLKSL